MSALPSVSIIIPCRNYAHLLPETLASVAEQTLSNWECLVVDDGSTDDTEHVVAAFSSEDKRFRYIRQEHSGPSIARNRGLEIASGEFIQFLDADDLLMPFKLQSQLGLLRSNDPVVMVYGGYRYFTSAQPGRTFPDFNLSDTPETLPHTHGTGDALLRQLLVANRIPVCAPLIRTAAIKQVGGFDTKLHGCEDWDLWIRMAFRGGAFVYADMPDTAVLIRRHAGSSSCNQLMMMASQLAMRHKIAAGLHSPDLVSLNREYLMRTAIGLAYLYRTQKKWHSALNLYLRYTLPYLLRRLKQPAFFARSELL